MSYEPNDNTQNNESAEQIQAIINENNELVFPDQLQMELEM